ncbi:hypothetical protein [Arthrobacter sp. TE12232]
MRLIHPEPELAQVDARGIGNEVSCWQGPERAEWTGGVVPIGDLPGSVKVNVGDG